MSDDQSSPRKWQFGISELVVSTALFSLPFMLMGITRQLENCDAPFLAFLTLGGAVGGTFGTLVGNTLSTLGFGYFCGFMMAFAVMFTLMLLVVGFGLVE